MSFFTARQSTGPVKVGPAISISNASQMRAEGPALVPVVSPGGGITIIERHEQVPQHHGVLTSGDTRSIIRIPKHLEYALAVIEIGAKRVAILYDPEAPSKEIADLLKDLRNKLTVEGYQIDRGEMACRPAVIKMVVDEYRAALELDSDDGSAVHSRARELWERIVELAARAGATDIHAQLVKAKGHVKIRVHGELEPLPDGQSGVYSAKLLEAAFGWGFTNGAESDSNSDSLYHAKSNLYAMIKPRAIDGKQVGLRYQSIVGGYGPKVVCRLLNTDTDAPTRTYDELGYSPSHIALLLEAARTPSGMILFAGVTGSGKTTSQKTFIETHPGNGTSAFYSIEDPIEYPLRGVHQIPLQRDLLDKVGSAAKYAEVIAGLMRADPDGVLLGEIRDAASAMAAQQIVQTGHMASATVHAHLVTGILPRLTDDEIGMSRQVITNPNMLSLLAYQALVPVLCPHCRINGTDNSELTHVRHGSVESATSGKPDALNYIFKNLEKRFNLGRELFNFRRHGGCGRCNQRGTIDLTVVAEMTIPDRTWLTLIREDRDYDALTHYRASSDGRFDSDDMTGKTVFEHTLFKAMMGNVDPRECERFDSFSRFEITKRD
jgi:general secretion pathway protein E